MTGSTPAIPPAAIQRFVAAYGAFVELIEAAVENAARRIADTLEPDDGRVSAGRRLLSLLETRYRAIRAAANDVANNGCSAIVNCALEAGALSKNLDFVRLDFAGPEERRQMDELVTRIVLSAYSVYSAARLG